MNAPLASPSEAIGVIGTGYVGLVTAAGFAELSADACCIDVDAEKVERLRRGEIPIHEPGLEELVTRHRARPALLHRHRRRAGARAATVVAVGTPPTYSGDADLSAVHGVVAAMPRSGPTRS
jgi:UDPglucose 6-dehydrogenase